MTGYLWRGQPGLEELNAQIIAGRTGTSQGGLPRTAGGDRSRAHGVTGWLNGCTCGTCRRAGRERRWRQARKGRSQP